MLEVQVVNGILNAHTMEEVGAALHQLAEIFGDTVLRVVPKRINEAGVLDGLLAMATELTRLRSCPGFSEHIKPYKTNPAAAYFATHVAVKLMDKVDTLVLEPAIPGKEARADIKASVGNNSVYIECKSPLFWSKWKHVGQLRELSNTLRPYINVPHQVDVLFEQPLDTDEAHALGRRLADLLPHVTGNGVVLQTPKYKVTVSVCENVGTKTIELSMPFTVHDSYTQTTYLGRWFLTGGKNIAIAGPRIDCREHLRKAISRGRSQSPEGVPFVLAIDADELVGSFRENLAAAQEVFRPDINSRFSAVLLLPTAQFLGKPDTIPEAIRPHLVTNPFARHPLDAPMLSVLRRAFDV